MGEKQVPHVDEGMDAKENLLREAIVVVAMDVLHNQEEYPIYESEWLALGAIVFALTFGFRITDPLPEEIIPDEGILALAEQMRRGLVELIIHTDANLTKEEVVGLVKDYLRQYKKHHDE